MYEGMILFFSYSRAFVIPLERLRLFTHRNIIVHNANTYTTEMTRRVLLMLQFNASASPEEITFSTNDLHAPQYITLNP